LEAGLLAGTGLCKKIGRPERVAIIYILERAPVESWPAYRFTGRPVYRPFWPVQKLRPIFILKILDFFEVENCIFVLPFITKNNVKMDKL